MPNSALPLQYILLQLLSFFAAGFVISCGATLGYRLCKGK